MRIAVLGAGGTMGYPMARNLAQARLNVTAWNRSPDKITPLADHGVRVAGTPAEAAAGADIVVTILADAEAVLAAMDGPQGAAAAMTPDAVWVQMSTIGEAGTDECARLAADNDLTFIDAPVLGTRQPAELGELVVLASGPALARDRVQRIFDVVGGKTIWVGEAGDGTRLKLVANSWVLAVVEAGAETIALAEGLGVRPELFLDAISGGTLDLPYLRLKAAAIAERNFEPAFRLALAAKDAALVEEAADRHELDLPVVRAVRERLEEGARLYGDEDFSATYLTSAPRPI
ncbi:MAG TPA: NAD(P)-dependent oxidoreductase [Streptosporangiaceae bacterium]|nr:NAD(P)-dependent oxidoreductase [Streptosporangiaceae bacterium]